ncbi:AMP-binding protein, partial [Escherichia coli]|nr:AMP-binding protein [Escherichia coli]
LPQLPRLRHVVVIEKKGLRDTLRAQGGRVLSFEELEQRGAQAEAREGGFIDEVLRAQQLCALALMIYTSGSTGRPKGAMITYANIRAVVP